MRHSCAGRMQHCGCDGSGGVRERAGAPMVPDITFERTLVNTLSDDVEGRLVRADGHLVAVLVRLDGEEHGNLRGRWLLEAGFGPCSRDPCQVFGTLDAATDWVCAEH